MSEKKRRRDQRLNDPRPMRLTDRDKAIIEAVHQYRVLRQDQVQQLFFGSQSAAQRVLARLYDHSFLDRRFVPVLSGRSPTFYVLDRRGADLLRAELGYDELTWHHSSKDLKAEFLEHTLAINDVRIAVTVACRDHNSTLLTWLGETDLKADYDHVRLPNERRPVSVIPDSYFVLDTPRGKAHFFVELDRGTMTTGRFKTKVAAYVTYHRSGAYEKRYQTRSLRILVVTLSAVRRDNLRQVTTAAASNFQHRFWFALAADISPHDVLTEPIWLVADEPAPRPLIEL